MAVNGAVNFKSLCVLSTIGPPAKIKINDGKNYIFNVWNIRHFNDFIQDINVINNAGYHFSWSIDIENKIKSFSHQELNDPKTIKKFINYKHVLENCEIVKDLPDFIKLNYSQYFYKHDDL